MMGWLVHVIALAVTIPLMGCQSSPTPNWASETIGFTRASQPGGAATLWIMKGEGSGQSPLQLGAEGNSSLTWSPDGNSIAFVSVRDGNPELYTAQIIDKDGTVSVQDIHRRTTSPADDSFPAWSHDCAWLAFSSNRGTQTSYNIYRLHLHDNAVMAVTIGENDDSAPSWSPDGNKIAFVRKTGDASGEIYVHMMNSGQEIRLTNNSVNDTTPSWSPAGRIIFARYSEDGSRAALFEMDAVDADGDGNGDHLNQVSTPDEHEYDHKPEYSGSGRAIVFVRSQEAGGEGAGDVWKLLIQDGTIMDPLQNLTRTRPQHEYNATWKPNRVCAAKGKEGPQYPPLYRW